MLPITLQLSLLLWTAQWATLTLAQNCYTPGGEDRNEMFGTTEGMQYVPCNRNAKHSMCCSSGPRGSGDKCQSCEFWQMSNLAEAVEDLHITAGLCYNEGGNVWWRESCTDPTWQDPACVRLFVNGTGLEGNQDSSTGINNITDVDITPCENGSWCYGTGPGALSCCQAGQGLFIGSDNRETTGDPNTSSIAPTAAASSGSAFPDSATSSASSAALTSTTSPSALPNTSSPNSLSTAVKAGIGIGVGLGVLLLIVLVMALVLFFRRRRPHSPAMVTPLAESFHPHGVPTSYYKPPPSMKEMPQAELNGAHHGPPAYYRPELPAVHQSKQQRPAEMAEMSA